MDHEANTNNVVIPPNPWRHRRPERRATTVIYDPATGNPLDGTGAHTFSGQP